MTKTNTLAVSAFAAELHSVRIDVFLFYAAVQMGAAESTHHTVHHTPTGFTTFTDDAIAAGIILDNCSFV